MFGAETNRVTSAAQPKAARKGSGTRTALGLPNMGNLNDTVSTLSPWKQPKKAAGRAEGYGRALDLELPAAAGCCQLLPAGVGCDVRQHAADRGESEPASARRASWTMPVGFLDVATAIVAGVLLVSCLQS